MAIGAKKNWKTGVSENNRVVRIGGRNILLVTRQMKILLSCVNVNAERYYFGSPLEKDRFMAPDMDAVAEILREEKVWNAVKPHMDRYFMEQGVETRPSSPTTSSIHSNQSLHYFKKRRHASNNSNGYPEGYIIAYEGDEDLNHKMPMKTPRPLYLVDE